MVCDKNRACDTRGSPAPQVTRLPRKTKVDVTKCHACHAKRRWMSPSATPATQSATASRATKTGPSAPPEVAQCHKWHACHAKRRWMWPSATPATRNEGGCHQVPRRHRRPKPAQARHQSQLSAISATPATQNEGGCDQVPRLPRETKVDVTKGHACHAKCRGVTGDQNRPKRATRASPMPQVPRLPRKTKVYVAKCHTRWKTKDGV